MLVSSTRRIESQNFYSIRLTVLLILESIREVLVLLFPVIEGKLPWSRCQAVDAGLDGPDADHALARIRPPFVIPAKSPGQAQPPEGPFHHPPFGELRKTLRPRWTTHHFDLPRQIRPVAFHRFNRWLWYLLSAQTAFSRGQRSPSSCSAPREPPWPHPHPPPSRPPRGSFPGCPRRYSASDP